VTPLPWQQRAATRLREQLEADRLPHALLLTGPSGWGELALANWLALLIVRADVGLDAQTVAHPDLRWVGPDGAMIKIDAIRELVDFAQGKPQAGSRKAAVVAEAHAMNRSAANALLKTLEEPPPGTHLLLVSSRPGQLLPTIRSRCQQHTLHKDEAAARAWLAEQVETTDLPARLFEYGNAPVAIAAAAAAGERPLTGALTQAWRGDDLPALAGELLDQGLAGVTGRWLRYVSAALGGDYRVAGLAGVPPRALSRFAAELLWVRGQLLASNSVNERLMAERLLILWRNLAVS
jgi:DNA polymerase-3 subunit delta'